MSEFGSIRSLERGLQVLQVINLHNGIKAADIAKATSIPRPTVYRILETLEGQRFVQRDHTADKWRATLMTKSLSSGYRDEDWVSQFAVPEMIRLGKKILWPLDLVIFNDHKMEIRESTHNFSPYSIDPGMVGQHLPVLDTAGGRAYLAFSPENERERSISGLRGTLGLAGPIMLKDGPLSHILDLSREMGVAFRMQDFRDTTMSISAPIMRGGRVAACLTIIWTGSALKFEKALFLYRDKLLVTTRRISDKLAA